MHNKIRNISRSLAPGITFGLTLIWCYRVAWNRLFQRITTILPWPSQDILSEAVTLGSKQRSLEKWERRGESARKKHEIFERGWETQSGSDEEEKERDDINRQTNSDRERLKVNCSTGLALGLASVLESLSHPQWHVVSRPLPHHIIVLCAIMWGVHMYSTLCWLHKTHRPNCFCWCQCVPLNLI